MNGEIREDMFKLLGHIVPDGKRIWMVSSAAEVGFRVSGASRLLLRLQADDSVVDPAKRVFLPRFEVKLDGKKRIDVRMTTGNVMVTVFEGAEKRDAEVRLIKLNEGNSLFALRDVMTDGAIEPLPARPLKMEFIGDSITCGYGVEARNETETFTTATENATKGYAFLTAEALSADAVLTCFSGHGIVSGYTGDPSVRNEEALVPPYYEKEGRNDFVLPTGKRVQETDRDFSAFQPDYIVIHLGTNDLSWCGADEARGKLFARQYAAFLKTVRKDNPKARILCALGTMGTGLNPMMQEAGEAYCRETGDQEIRLLILDEQNAKRDGYGADFHPSEITHHLLARQMTQVIRRWMER